MRTQQLIDNKGSSNPGNPGKTEEHQENQPNNPRNAKNPGPETQRVNLGKIIEGLFRFCYKITRQKWWKYFSLDIKRPRTFLRQALVSVAEPAGPAFEEIHRSVSNSIWGRDDV
jgi:hypothetical protein